MDIGIAKISFGAPPPSDVKVDSIVFQHQGSSGTCHSRLMLQTLENWGYALLALDRHLLVRLDLSSNSLAADRFRSPWIYRCCELLISFFVVSILLRVHGLKGPVANNQYPKERMHVVRETHQA